MPLLAPIPRRAVLAVSGSDATQFLNGLLATSLHGNPSYSAFLHAQVTIVVVADSFLLSALTGPRPPRRLPLHLPCVPFSHLSHRPRPFSIRISAPPLLAQTIRPSCQGPHSRRDTRMGRMGRMGRTFPTPTEILALGSKRRHRARLARLAMGYRARRYSRPSCTWYGSPTARPQRRHTSVASLDTPCLLLTPAQLKKPRPMT